MPDFLTRGLAVTEKLIHAGIDVPDEGMDRLDKALMEHYTPLEKEDKDER